MSDSNPMSTSRTSKVLRASRKEIYRAFTDPEALALWLAPGSMRGQVHDFDLRIGGGYTMSLYYIETDTKNRGKTSRHEDRFTADSLSYPNQHVS